MENLKVLVVDDEPGIRLGIARVLQRYKVRVPDLNGEVLFAVSQAETGEEALALLRADAPDILLLDHKLPGISGLEVLDVINKEPHDWLTVMITAYATIDTAVHATDLPGSGHFGQIAPDRCARCPGRSDQFADRNDTAFLRKSQNDLGALSY